MARLTTDMGFTGKLGNLSAYRMKGSDKIIVRTKGGASKNKIKKHPNFAFTRRHNAEFGACSRAGTSVRRAMSRVNNLADHNISGKLNAIAHNIQKLDTVNPHGQRSICFSNSHQLLDGFSLNRQMLFNSVLRTPVSYQLNRSTNSATLVLPEIMPGINFHPPYQYSLYRFIITLGVLGDIVFDGKAYPKPVQRSHFPLSVETDWVSVKENIRQQQDINIRLKDKGGIAADQCLILTIGIQFGEPVTNVLVNPVKGGGCGVILATG